MAFAWGICIALGFIGWGLLLLRCLRLSHLPLGFAGPLGVGVVVAVGGWLNLAQLIVTPVLCLLVTIGALVCLQRVLTIPGGWSAVGAAIDKARKSPGFVLLAVVLIAALALLGFASSRSQLFTSDDTIFYLGYPQKVLLTGTLPFDPFNGTRTMSSLGANYFLQTFILWSGDMRSEGFLDTGIGYAFLAGLSYSLARLTGLSRRWGLGLAFVAASLPVLRNNLQMSVLPACLFLLSAAVVLIMEGWRLAVVLGLLLGTVSSLKGTYLPAAAVLVTLHYVVAATGTWRRRGTDLCLAALTAAALTGPWMFDARRKTGTFFYPLTGGGNVHEPSLPLSFPDIAGASLPLFLPLAVLAFLIYLAADRLRKSSPIGVGAFNLTVTSAFSVALIGYATRGDGVGRYNLPLIDAAAIVTCAWIFTEISGGPNRTRVRRDTWFKSATLLAGCWIFFLQAYYGFYQPLGDHRRQRDDIGILFSPLNAPKDTNIFLLDDASLARYQKAASAYQSVVPRGERILSVVPAPFAMDYRRNPIYVGDGTGFPDLKPGAPDQNQQELSQSLRDQQIRFVAFTTDPDPWKTLRDLNSITPGHRIRSHTQRIGQLTSLAALDILSRSVRVLFDDGHTRVVDLQQPPAF